MGFDAGDSNLYRYVNNSPTNSSDPSGKLVHAPLGAAAVASAFAAPVVVVGSIWVLWFGGADVVAKCMVRPLPDRLPVPPAPPPRPPRERDWQGDHIFATGFRGNLPRFSARVEQSWRAFSRALQEAIPLVNTAPFNEKVRTNRPRPDPHKIAFDFALERMRSSIEDYNVLFEQRGARVARRREGIDLNLSFHSLVQAVEDPVASAQTLRWDLVLAGRRTLDDIDFTVQNILLRPDAPG